MYEIKEVVSPIKIKENSKRYACIETSTEDHVGEVIVTKCEDDIININGLYVLTEHRNKGAGTKMLLHVLKLYGRDAVIELGVAQLNEGAIRLYKRLGFEIESEFKHGNLRMYRMTRE